MRGEFRFCGDWNLMTFEVSPLWEKKNLNKKICYEVVFKLILSFKLMILKKTNSWEKIPSFQKSLPILSYTLLELWSNLEEKKKKLLQASFMMSYNILGQRLIFHTFGLDYPQYLVFYHNCFSLFFSFFFAN